MTTNFDNNALSSSGGFKPSTKDTPIDIRSRVVTETDILEIPNPYVGMIIYVQDTGKRFEVLSIKDVQSGLSKVSRVDTYKEFMTGGSQEVDLSGLVAKNEIGNASQILFNDGQSFQSKLDNGSLQGPKGDQGIQGPKGDQGIQGEKGADGLTTSILVNGQTFTHENGVITLPDYPKAGTSVDTYSREEIDYIVEDYTGGKKQRYVTQDEYNILTEDEINDANIVWNITDAACNVDIVKADGSIPSINELYDLTGKTWNALGDSITAGITSDSQYVEMISTVNNMGTSTNHGMGGTSISGTSDNAFIQRYKNMSNGVDIVTVMGGTNDALNNVVIGTINSDDITTFYGGLNYLIDGLQTKYPDSRIIFITPLCCKTEIETAKITPYAQAIINICNARLIECIDMHNELILEEADFADGLHPNQSGQEKMAVYLESKMKLTESKAIQLMNKKDEYVYPVTSGSVVYMEDGRNIEEHIDTINDRVVKLERSSSAVIFLTSPNGTLFELKVSDTGDLSAVEYEGAACASISINKATASIFAEDTLQLTATVLPDYCIRPVIWSASNSNCMVDNGLVTGVSVGDCVITAQCGDKTATCNITVNEKINVDEPGLTAYYIASNHGDNDAEWLDISGNNNHATITGSGAKWEDDMLKITNTNTTVTFPFAPMADLTNNFRIEVEYSNNEFAEYTGCQLLCCLEEVNWVGGISVNASAATANETIQCRFGGVAYYIPREIVNAESFKLKLEHINSRAYIYVNDEMVNEGVNNGKPSDMNLYIGNGKVNVKYVKYYTNI